MTSSSGWPTADLLVDHPELRRAAEWRPAVRACSAHRYRDAHLWADQFDENRFDLLQMQDTIVARIAHAIGVKMTVERARWAQTRAVNPNAEDLAWRCQAAVVRTYWTPERDAAYRASKRCRSTLRIFARCPTYQYHRRRRPQSNSGRRVAQCVN
jgi:hypothetical protein